VTSRGPAAAGRGDRAPGDRSAGLAIA